MHTNSETLAINRTDTNFIKDGSQSIRAMGQNNNKLTQYSIFELESRLPLAKHTKGDIVRIALIIINSVCTTGKVSFQA